MTTKNVTMTSEELATLVATAVATALAAQSGPVARAKAVKTISPELRAKVLEAVKNDPKTTPGTRKDGTTYVGYKCFAGMVVASGVRKYGDKADFKAETLLAAAKGYGLA
jgi:uncharacterized membrane protein